MSPLPPSTSPSVVELGLSNHLHVKEVQPRGEDAELVKEVIGHLYTRVVMHCLNELVKEVQPQMMEVSKVSQEELDEGMKHREAHGQVQEFQPGKETKPESKATKPQTKPQIKFQPAESVKETQPEVKEVTTFQQQRQAEMDDWKKFRKAHEPVSLFQPGSSSSSVNEVQPHVTEVNSFQQQRQAEMDDWKQFRKDHEQVPTNPLKALAELLDIDDTPVSYSAVAQANVLAWKRKSKRRGRSFRAY